MALVVSRDSDFAAAQWARQDLEPQSSYWSDLSQDQQKLADELGVRAAHGDLSIFVGAGVSKPVGFPDWKELLEEHTPDNLDGYPPAKFPELAQQFKIDSTRVAERFTTEKYALGHALLVDLQTKAMVTTNYDPCLENASRKLDRALPLRVLTRELAIGDRPWLLKLHGDAAKPDSIVLTTDQYKRLEKDHGALRGVVQSLMLTNHVLFVGFGFADVDFLARAKAVQTVRKLAEDPDPDTKVGTAIQLLETTDRPRHEDLDYRQVDSAGGDVATAARLLEILLDRLSWRCLITSDKRSAYLLDPAFECDASADDRAVRDALLNMHKDVSAHKSSSGYRAVTELMTRLGFRDVSL